LAFTAGIAGVAVAATAPAGQAASGQSDRWIGHLLDGDTNMLLWWFADPTDPAAPGSCDAVIADPSVDPPEGCHLVDVTGPQGQVTHGSVVSLFVHDLQSSDVDGPMGRYVREIARSDDGKRSPAPMGPPEEHGVAAGHGGQGHSQGHGRSGH